MAHSEQRVFFETFKSVYPEFFSDVSVIEIGSLDINGSVRDLFTASRYVGVDLGEGKGVDLVAEGQDVDFPDASFDVAVSAECFEHNPYWAESFENMHRMASKAVIFTCASYGRPEHGTTRTTPEDAPLALHWDYYRNLGMADFMMRFRLRSMFSRYAFIQYDSSHDLFFWGIK